MQLAIHYQAKCVHVILCVHFPLWLLKSWPLSLILNSVSSRHYQSTDTAKSELNRTKWCQLCLSGPSRPERQLNVRHMRKIEKKTASEILITSFKTISFGGLPWLYSGWELACQCRRQGFNPWPGKIPHATEQLNPHLQLLKLMCLEPVLCNKRSSCITTKSSPHSLQLEKAQA